MSTWKSKGHPRGLLAWGETRKKDKNGNLVVKRLGKFAHICRSAAIQGIEYYWKDVGLPPVDAGESLKNAIKDGRYKLANKESYPSVKGATRGQQKLIELLPPVGPQRFWEVFVFVVSAAYCEYLDPPIDDGTDASYAVLGLFQEKEVKAKLLAQVRASHIHHVPAPYTHTIYPPNSVQDAFTASTVRACRASTVHGFVRLAASRRPCLAFEISARFNSGGRRHARKRADQGQDEACSLHGRCCCHRPLAVLTRERGDREKQVRFLPVWETSVNFYRHFFICSEPVVCHNSCRYVSLCHKG